MIMVEPERNLHTPLDVFSSSDEAKLNTKYGDDAFIDFKTEVRMWTAPFNFPWYVSPLTLPHVPSQWPANK